MKKSFINAIVFTTLTLTLVGCATNQNPYGKVTDKKTRNVVGTVIYHEGAEVYKQENYTETYTSKPVVPPMPNSAITGVEAVAIGNTPAPQPQQQVAPAPQPAPQRQSAPTGGPRYRNGRLLENNNGWGASNDNGRAMQVSNRHTLRAQPAILFSGIGAFLSGGSRVPQRSTGVKWLDKGVEHQRSVNPDFDRERVGTTKVKTHVVSAQIRAAARAQSGRSNRLGW